jgi:hypothetical protein
LTTIPFLAHQGIWSVRADLIRDARASKPSFAFDSFVPIGFVAPQLADNSEIVGGSAYGAASIAGKDGLRELTEKELAVAAYQGTYFTKIVSTYVAGKSA